MTQDYFLSLVHRKDSTLPPVRPCNMANASNSKTIWSAEDIHHYMGCRKYWNYKHLLQVSNGGNWVDGGEFPPSLGLFSTVSKANQSFLIDCTHCRYLDVVHMDIAIGNCLSVSGFCCALILVHHLAHCI
jgi:hypothetical protein